MKYVYIFLEKFWAGLSEAFGFFVALILILMIISWLDLEFTVKKRLKQAPVFRVEESL